MNRARAATLVAVLSLLVAGLWSAVDGTAAAAVPETPFPSADVTFTGHGWGPGYGLGQWGAFGFAAVDHWTYHQLLVHYYSDTASPVTDATLDLKSDGELVKVVIEENDNSAVTVRSPSAFSYVDSAGKTVASIAAGQVGRAVEIAKAGVLTGLWQIETASSCSATGTSWKTLATGVSDPAAVPASLQATAPTSQLLTLCRADGQDVTYRGRLEAFDYYGAATNDEHLERTLNIIAIEQFLSDVTPGESPSGWGTYGGTTGAPDGEPWGFQELEAQAVAARTYLLYSKSVGGWYGYADICDDSCEWYGDGIKFETPLATRAVRDTAGQYLVQSGQPAPTEYGSSSGGYTEAMNYGDGKSIFDSIRDLGDAVCIGGQGSLGCNPVHTWTVSLAVTAVEAAFPSVGTLESVKVTSTDASGRVNTIEIVGTKATDSVSGATFTYDFGGFLSTMFAVTDGLGATAVAPAGARPVGRIGFGSPGFRPPAGLLPSRTSGEVQH